MQSWWVKFADHAPGCVEAESSEGACFIATQLTGKPAISAKILPYPAQPCINKHEYPKYGPIPSFCFRPEQCAGRTSCPQRRSCVD